MYGPLAYGGELVRPFGFAVSKNVSSCGADRGKTPVEESIGGFRMGEDSGLFRSGEIRDEWAQSGRHCEVYIKSKEVCVFGA